MTAPCSRCNAPLDDKTITVDRIVPGSEGGGYARKNIRPMCAFCNSSEGSKLRHAKRKAA